MSALEILIAVVTGIAAGAFAGSMGVGGGVIMVPVLVEILDLTQHRAQGTSLAVIIVTAVAGSLVARRAGLLEGRTIAWVAIGGVGGAVAGSLLATTALDEMVLRRGFGVIVLLTAARMIGETVRARRRRSLAP